LEGFSDETKAVVVLAAVTVSPYPADVLVAKVESPAYVALIVSVPFESVDGVKVATPPLNWLVPRTVDPSLKVTVSPFGGDPSEEVTVAVKVTACPYAEGFWEDVTAVFVEVRALRLEADASSTTSATFEIFMRVSPSTGGYNQKQQV
jgi:hypothetical protein